MKQVIYADNAATTKLDIEAFEAMKVYLLNDYANSSQPYSFSRSAKKALKNARQIIAECINAEPEEIFFTSGGSESDNWAIKGIAQNGMPGKIIVSKIEHHAVLKSCAEIERDGYEVEYIKPNSDGIVTAECLSSHMSGKTKLVSIMLVNNEIGTVQPIKKLSAIAHELGSIFHTDAVQAMGHIKIDVKDLGVDLLSASAHKFNGPKGIGFLYIKNGTNIKPLINGGDQEFKQRAGTENIASIVGMAVALKNNCDRIESNNLYIKKLEGIVLDEIKGIEFVLNCSRERKPGIMSLSFPGRDGEQLLHRLDLKGIMVSTGAACDSVNTQISHVLSAISMDEKLANGTIRISLGKNNTEEEAHQIGQALIDIINNNK